MTPPRSPRVILLADRSGEELLPLTRAGPTALLAIAARPLLGLCLESVKALSPPRVDLIVCAHSERIRAYVAEGNPWSLRLDTILSRGEEAPAAVLSRAARLAGDECLVMRADMLRTGNLAGFLSQARALQTACTAAMVGDQPAGLWYCRGVAGLAAVPGWPLPADTDTAERLPLDQGQCAALDSLEDFHRTSLQAAAGSIPGLRLPGRQADDGLLLGRGAQCAVRPAPDSRVIVGRGSRVLSGVELSGRVVIDDHVIIDRDCRIEETVVLPHSYVGASVELRQAIVCGNDLVRIDSGARLTVVDAFLLADLKQPELTGPLAALLNRLAGLLLLGLSLPLWPAAALAALLRHPGQMIRQRTLLGNAVGGTGPGSPQRQAFNYWQWNTAIPILRELPRLLATVRGELRLLGPAPLEPDEAAARDADWQYLADESPAGLLGPTQLLLDARSPLEERLLSDTFFIRQRSLRNDLIQLLRALACLFSRRAWRPEATP